MSDIVKQLKSLDQYYERGVRDGMIADSPPDPFLVTTTPGGYEHKDHRHLRRAYDAGFREGRRLLDPTPTASATASLRQRRDASSSAS